MPYVTSWERMGLKRGLEQGLREAIEIGLRARFGKRGVKLFQRLRKITELARLREIQKALVKVGTVEEIEGLLGE